MILPEELADLFPHAKEAKIALYCEPLNDAMVEFEIDQTYLPEIVRQCRLIAKNYPARGLQSERGI